MVTIFTKTLTQEQPSTQLIQLAFSEQGRTTPIPQPKKKQLNVAHCPPFYYDAGQWSRRRHAPCFDRDSRRSIPSHCLSGNGMGGRAPPPPPPRHPLRLHTHPCGGSRRPKSPYRSGGHLGQSNHAPRYGP